MPVVGRDYGFGTLERLEALPFKSPAASGERSRLPVSGIMGTRSRSVPETRMR